MDIQEIKVVCFRLGEDLYAADIMRVREIIKPQKPAGMPNMPAFVDGVINLRGAVIPILDLHKRFQLPAVEPGKRTRLLIVSLSGQALGLVVDEVTEVVTVAVNDLRPPPQFVQGVGAGHLIAVCLVRGAPVMLLNLDTVLRDQEADELLRLEAVNPRPDGAIPLAGKD